MKKSELLLLAILGIFLLFFPLLGHASDDVPLGMVYIIEDGTVKISYYRHNANELFIPAEIKGYPVTKLGRNAFFGCKDLTSITIPDTVITIDDNAFWGCESLTSITIPDSVTSIGSGAFWDCKSLTNITIPDSVTSIGSGAFWRCESLTSITIPDSVISLGERPFYLCISLMNIMVSPNNPAYMSVDGVLFNKDKTLLIQYPVGRLTQNYTLPQGTQKIGAGAFEECLELTSITIPDSVISIDDEAFRWCGHLSNLTIPNNVTSIGEGVFDHCYALSNIFIPESITSIGEDAFNDCLGLTDITVSPNNPVYTSVDGVLFSKDKTLLIQYPIGRQSESYTIPQGTQKIGHAAFFDCSYLISIILPDSVISIGESAFECCWDLTNINIPRSVSSIGYAAFRYCDINSITIPSSVTAIGDLAFDEIDELTDINVEKDSYAHQWCLHHGYENIIRIFDNNTALVNAAKDRYSIYVDDPYYYPQYDMVILRKGIGIHLMVHDRETDQVLVTGQVENLAFRQIEKERFGSLNDNNVFYVHKGFKGAYNIALTYNGVEIDRISVFCSLYDEDEYSPNLRLDTMQFFNWQKEGMWISPDLKIFDFKAELKNNMPTIYPDGYYAVSMEIYNTSPVIYGVLVYDNQDKIINTSYINSFWSEFSAWGAIEYVYLGFRDFWDFRVGNTESYACKSVINIKVPVGGCIRFADPMETDELITANYINGALSILSTMDSWESLIDVIGINNKAAFRKALKEMEWDDFLSEITFSYQQSTTADIREEALKAVLKGGWETIISDKNLMESIAVAIQKSFVSLGVNELADYGLLAVSVPSYYIMHATDGLGQSIQLNNLKNMLIQSDQGDSLIKIKNILFSYIN